MRISDIPRRSELAYKIAVKHVIEQIELELEVWRDLLGTDPEKVIELLASTPDWNAVLEEDEENL